MAYTMKAVPGLQGHPFVRTSQEIAGDAEKERSRNDASSNPSRGLLTASRSQHMTTQTAEGSSTACMLCGMGEEQHRCAVSPRVQERFDAKIKASTRRALRAQKTRSRWEEEDASAEGARRESNGGFSLGEWTDGKGRRLVGLGTTSRQVAGFVARLKLRRQSTLQESDDLLSQQQQQQQKEQVQQEQHRHDHQHQKDQRRPSGKPELVRTLTCASSVSSATGSKRFLAMPSEQVFMDQKVRFLHDGRLWMLVDLCVVLDLDVPEAESVLDKTRDLEFVEVGPEGGAAKAFVNDSGLLKLALRLRSVRARKLHDWCQDTREAIRNGVDMEDQSSSSVRQRARGSRAMNRRWRSERERAAQLAALNPERMREETLGALFARARSTDSWRACGETEKYKLGIYTQHFVQSARDDYLHIKCEVILDVPPATVYKLISTWSSWSSWDEIVGSMQEIEELDASTTMLHLRLKPFRPIDSKVCANANGVLPRELTRARDFCVMRFCSQEFREYAIALHSVAWRLCPPSPRTPVRGRLRSSGFVIEAANSTDGFVDDMKCKVTLVWCMDLRQSEGTRVPDFLRQYIIREKCKCMDNLAHLFRPRGVASRTFAR
ncbi:Acyl-coenzyme A thioesterase 12 [Hondaea fermentalgiana]|uniref:Acyl-coenzyme A thioesterase 12 n=1 Tax=Hondaea fermentalgiana TaxID=2315210 RepID=A0A2R5GU06_9STRA|nr:Acyl-coenzyme A thioesterase 12 [Hondaea fermentalgiana]|eukprot:GBG33238.1 Acyl-coenzyme A thioesterase 12 [Hondaea fermentalgiana]